MNSPTKLIPLILTLMMSATLQASASPCGDCEKPNPDPYLALAVPCVPKDEFSDVPNEPCKECDGHGNVRNKKSGTPIPGEDCKVCDGKGGERNKWSGTPIPGEDCKVCDGAGGEKNKDPGALIPGEYCKECDGKGGVREKKDGTMVVKNLRKGYCCGGVWHNAGPKPPGCFKMSPPTCKWEPYTPDCKVYEDMITKLMNFGWSLLHDLLLINMHISNVQVCCDCENGDKWACAKGRNCGNNECDHVDQLKINRDYIMWRIDQVDMKLKDAKKRLDDCQNCKK